MGYGDDFLAFLSHFGAQESVNYLLPHLQPGQRVLDVGCGPGFITLGIADAVAPGECYGVDLEASQIEIAQRLAADQECANAVFLTADAAALPFEDGFFDVVNCADVLAYIPSTADALAEVKRVLKPGGLMAGRDIIIDSSFTFPDEDLLMRRGFDVFADLLAADDGHPQFGKEFKHHLEQAGFTDIRVSAGFDVFGTPERVAVFYELIKRWFFSEDITEAAKKYGAASEALLYEVYQAVEDWVDQPGNLACMAYGSALAIRP